ncbi:MAG: hypothetical protein ACXVCT_21425 [Ktedonobacterales bacterium]
MLTDRRNQDVYLAAGRPTAATGLPLGLLKAGNPQSGNPTGRPKGARNRHSENFINAFAQDFERHGSAVIEKVRKERPHDYLKIAASLLTKQSEIETMRTRPPSELTDAELMDLLLDGIEGAIEAVLVSRGHAPLTAAERQQLQHWERGETVNS